MADNLVLLLNKLSYQIVTQEFEREKDTYLKKKDEKYFKKCVQRLRQRGCDVLLNKTSEPPPEDPCLTDYGGNWNPMTLIEEYGRDLKSQGALRGSDVLHSSAKTLEEGQFDNLNEILKVLLMLKKPFADSSKHCQNEIAFHSVSEILSNSLDSFSLLSGEFPRDLSRSSFKRATQYEETWTKTFDSKFRALGEYSKKNLLMPEKLSVNCIFTANSLAQNQSQSNSFVFTDFFFEKNNKSEKSLFYSNNSDMTEYPLLDSFVETPMTHKLRSVSFSQKYSSRSDFLERSNEQMKRKLHYLPEEDSCYSPSEARSLCSESVINKALTLKSSAIELKRNSNYGHSFSIMYQKSKLSRSDESSLESCEDLLLIRNTNKSSKCVSRSSQNSKEIVLGLWEQEQKLMKEFRPDLAESFPKLRMITLIEFVQDVKHLVTGISSSTFKYDYELKKFNMEYGTCLEDVTPESLFHFSEEFLDIGNCYVWLSAAASEVGKGDLGACMTISQAFWKSVFDFLELHYSVILEIPPSTSLMTLKSCTKDLHEMIRTIAEMCKVTKPSEDLPQGGELLTYLLEMAEKVSRQCITNIIFGILQNCCNVYFMCILQTWMFKGQFENRSNEFFVDYRRQKVKTKSRTYYNSFFIAEEKIPSFLWGYEENIFNCGKSIHFLKLFNPEDKFCQFLEKSEYPNMRLCLSDVELTKLEREFKEYENKVIDICGESISIKTIREEEKENERCYQEHVRECKKLQEEKRELIRLKELEDLKAKKELQNKLRNEQRNFIEAEKERKKREEERENKKLDVIIEKANEKKEKMLKEEEGVIKSYYDDLLKALETQLTLAEVRKENLKKILTDNIGDSEILDVINDNKTEVKEETNDNERDAEGNIPEKLELDVNSNSRQPENVTPVVEETPKPENMENLRKTVLYDVNSNPECDSLKYKPSKSISHRTIAAVEAENNKLKILRSEFGLDVRKESKLGNEKKKETEGKPMTDLERNRKRVLESEYDILKNMTDTTSLKSIPSTLEMVKENSKPTVLHSTKSYCDEEENFDVVKLERKPECTNFGDPSKTLVMEIPLDSSSESVVVETPSTEAAEPTEETVSASTIQNEDYRKALMRDLEMFHRKLSYHDIFGHLMKGVEPANSPCTDFLQFQRYLRKSVLIPLKTQEKLANDALLKHLLKGENLLSHLNSLRGYFFLNDGEFGRSFTHNTFRSLAKCMEPQQFFERSNLSNIVNEALNYTIHNCEPNSHNLSFQIVQMPPYLNHASHDVLSPFELSYKVDWPLNLILTEKALSKYKMVFAFLLKLKRINWTLNENFLCLNSHFKNKNVNSKKLLCSSHYHKIQIYRHAMTQVMITLDEYIFSDGIQFPWIFFLKDLETTENIDHLYQKHVRYIKDVLTRCFLSKNSEDLLNCIHNLIELALKFHYTAKSSSMEEVHGKYIHPKFQVLKSTFNEFCLVIKTFLKTLKEKISSNQVLKSHYVLVEKFDLKLA